MRPIFLLFFVFTAICLFAQKENIPVTEQFSIEGKVKKEMTLSLADLVSYKSYPIDSIVIKNHLGEKRSKEFY